LHSTCEVKAMNWTVHGGRLRKQNTIRTAINGDYEGLGGVCLYLINTYFVLRLVAGPPPKLVLHRVSSCVSFLTLQYLFVSLRSPNKCVRLLPRLPFPSVFPLITCFRRKFLRKKWQIHVAFLLFVVCRMFSPALLSLILHSLFHCRSDWSRYFSSATFQKFQGTSHLRSEESKFQHHTKLCIKFSHFTTFVLKFKSSLTAQRVFFYDVCMTVHH